MNCVQIAVILFETVLLPYSGASKQHLIGVLAMVLSVIVVCYTSVFAGKKKVGDSEDKNRDKDREGEIK